MILLYVFTMLTIAVERAAASDLRPTSVSSITQGTNRLYTVKYTSSSQATVIWNDRGLIYNTTMANITDTFSHGNGESRFLATFPTTSVAVSLNIQGEGAFFSYLFRGVTGEVTLPETEIVSPVGQTFVYTPGIRFNATLWYSRESSGYSQADMMWYFVGIDNHGDVPVLETAGPWDPNIERFVGNETKTTHGSYYEVSVQVNLESQEGMVITVTTYTGEDVELNLYRTEIFYLRQSNHTQPFPSDYLGIFNPYEMAGYQEIPCTNSFCSIYCHGVGLDIDRVELRKIGSETLLKPAMISPTRYMYMAEYSLFPATQADSGSYICTVFDRNNESEEKELRVRVY